MSTFDKKLNYDKNQKIIAETRNDIAKLLDNWQESCAIQNDFQVENDFYVDEDLLFRQIKEFRFVVFVNAGNSFFTTCNFYKWLMRNVKNYTDKILNSNIVYYEFSGNSIKLFLDKGAIEIDLVFVAINNENVGIKVVKA